MGRATKRFGPWPIRRRLMGGQIRQGQSESAGDCQGRQGDLGGEKFAQQGPPEAGGRGLITAERRTAKKKDQVKFARAVDQKKRQNIGGQPTAPRNENRLRPMRSARTTQGWRRASASPHHSSRPRRIADGPGGNGIRPQDNGENGKNERTTDSGAPKITVSRLVVGPRNNRPIGRGVGLWVFFAAWELGQAGTQRRTDRPTASTTEERKYAIRQSAVSSPGPLQDQKERESNEARISLRAVPRNASLEQKVRGRRVSCVIEMESACSPAAAVHTP